MTQTPITTPAYQVHDPCAGPVLWRSCTAGPRHDLRLPVRGLAQRREHAPGPERRHVSEFFASHKDCAQVLAARMDALTPFTRMPGTAGARPRSVLAEITNQRYGRDLTDGDLPFPENISGLIGFGPSLYSPATNPRRSKNMNQTQIKNFPRA